MKIPTRTRPAPPLPGTVGTIRTDRRTSSLVSRLAPGDIALIDHRDLDRQTAQALVDSGIAAVLDVAPLLSGRYPALGPSVLVDAGIPVVDSVQLGAGRLSDGDRVRVHDGTVTTVAAEPTELATGRPVDRALLETELTQAREGLASQLESFTHNSAEFLRREQDLLLHGQGLPRLATRLQGRPVVVVVAGRDHAAELAAIRSFVREQDPVLIAVDAGGVEALRAAGHAPDVVVLDGTVDPDDQPSPAAIKKADDLVVVMPRGSGRAAGAGWERLGLRPRVVESGALAEDVALMSAETGGASVIVGVGMHATLHEFLDRRRSGLASTYLTRLRVGERLVDARAVPTLYAGRVRPRHLVGVALAGLVAVLAAVATTPVGQGWAEQLLALLPDALPDALPSSLPGALPETIQHSFEGLP